MSQVLKRKRIPIFAIALALALLLGLAISVTALAPVANDDAYTTDEDTPLAIAAPGVLANDSDPENDPLFAFLGSSPANGDLTLNIDGSFVYTPTPLPSNHRESAGCPVMPRFDPRQLDGIVRLPGPSLVLHHGQRWGSSRSSCLRRCSQYSSTGTV